MTPDHPVFCLARFTLEGKTPLSIASGTRNGGFDMALACDANGLPYLPGSSLAGVLRSAYTRQHGDDEARALFGWQQRNEGAPSVLHVASGVLQDSLGHAREGLMLDAPGRKHLQTDALLGHAYDQLDRPLFRDRVRLTHKGTADATGKFERVVLPAGNRFSCEITLWTDRRDDPRWVSLLKLLSGSALRLGGGTRNGLGEAHAVSLAACELKLDEQDDYEAFTRLGREIDDLQGLNDRTVRPPAPPEHMLRATVRITPNTFWRVGQGKTALGHYEDGDAPRLLPLTEPRVAWQDGKGEVGEAEVLLPGSSVKGALAHRQCFHLNRLQGKWADRMVNSMPTYDKSEDSVIQALYGFARGDEEKPRAPASTDEAGKSSTKKEPTGQAGRLFIADVFVTDIADAVGTMPHNSIDRFTGGVRDRLLFGEELLWRTPIEIQIELDREALERDIGGDSLDLLKKSLAKALDDLVTGRLALGSACARGHGFFNGKVEWSDGGEWIKEKSAQLQEGAA